MKTVVLASTSPRRSQLLAQIGVQFVAVSPEYEEDMSQAMPAAELAVVLAEGKAHAVTKVTGPNDVIVGGDTFIEFTGELLGKPHTPQVATDMLVRQRGQEVLVHTGWAVIDNASPQVRSGCVTSRVQMRHYDDEEIAAYVATGEPLDKAAAWAITGKGALLIDKVTEGDISAIIGLPVGPVARALEAFGVRIW